MKVQFRRIFGTVGLVAAALFLFSTGCGKSYDKGTNYGGDNPPPGGTYSHLVTMTNSTFSPPSITVSVGDTVTWRNDQSIGHTVTSNTGNTLNSPVLSQGQIYQHVFTSANSYPYHCTLHPGMTGTVTVQ